MDKIQFHDGTEMPVLRCGAADHVLWITIECGDLKFTDVSELFSNEEKTADITYIAPIERISFVGYTNLIVINKDMDAHVYLVALKE